MEYFIIERTLGNPYATVTRDGETFRVPFGTARIGPFSSIAAAAEYLSTYSGHTYHASYEIELIKRPT